jgi:hypothetical protein
VVGGEVAGGDGGGSGTGRDGQAWLGAGSGEVQGDAALRGSCAGAGDGGLHGRSGDIRSAFVGGVVTRDVDRGW